MANLKGFHLLIEDPDYKIYESDNIAGLLAFERQLFEDPRGFFQELCRFEPVSQALGRPFEVKQMSLTLNRATDIRAMHAEPIDKAVAAITGKGMMAWTDIRTDSDSFGQTSVVEFDYETDSLVERICMIVPSGLANGVMFTKTGFYIYAVSGTYQGGEKRAFRWNDPDAAIPWPAEPNLISMDDANKHPFLRQMFPEKFND